jgi:hypothetical protein
MKKIAQISLKSVFGNIDPYKLDNTFELFGLDYMIDEDFKVYLIEVNTNPCLEISSTLLARLIPNMIDNVLRYSLYVTNDRIAIDPIFPPPEVSHWSHNRKESLPENMFESNKFELIFDELKSGNSIKLKNKFITGKWFIKMTKFMKLKNNTKKKIPM